MSSLSQKATNNNGRHIETRQPAVRSGPEIDRSCLNLSQERELQNCKICIAFFHLLSDRRCRWHSVVKQTNHFYEDRQEVKMISLINIGGMHLLINQPTTYKF